MSVPRSTVSVIITCHNSSEKELRRAVDTVLQQSYPINEVIIVDDGSEIPFSRLDEIISGSNILWVPLNSNVGVGAARNIGLKYASGEYIAYLDHDDWWESDKIKKQMAVICSSGNDWVYCGMVRHFPDGRTLTEMPKYSGDIYVELLKEQIITGSISSILVSRRVMLELEGFSESRDLIEDWDMWIRLSRDHSISYVDEVLVHLSTPASGSRSKNIEARLKRLNGIIEKYEAELAEHNLLRYATARYCRVKVRLYQKSGDFPNAISALLRCLLKCSPQVVLSGFIYSIFITLPIWLKSR